MLDIFNKTLLSPNISPISPIYLRLVQNMERRLERLADVDADQEAKPVVIVSCSGTDEKLVKSIKKYQKDLEKINSFKDGVKALFKFVKKTGANVGSRLSVLKSIALGSNKGDTVPCKQHGNCKGCKLI